MHIILFFTYRVKIGDWIDSGLFEREIELYKELVKKGYKVTFLSYDSKNYFDTLSSSGINHIPVFSDSNIPKSKIIYFLKSFLIIFKRQEIFKDADIFKTNQLLGSWIAIFSKLIFKKKLIVRTGYDLLEFTIQNNKSWNKKFLYYLLTQFALFSSDLYSVTSNSDKQLLDKRFVKTKDIKIRSNWVYIPKEMSISNRLNSSLLMVGRLEKQKNFLSVIEQLKNSRYKVDIYGKGSEKQLIEVTAFDNAVNVSIIENTKNKELIKVYSRYKFFLLPSLFEGNPKALLEAMAAGCVVIASDISNHKEIIKSHKNGILFNFKEDNLIELLDSLSLKEGILKNISMSAVEYIKKNNSLDSYIEKEMSDYQLLFK